ncbi:MAG: VanW family protein [Clostridia bacterium]|nr:VanW family protein [Clostridia bacterium]
MGKRVLALFLAVVMLAGAFSLSAFAELQTTDGLWNYSVVSGGALVLKYNGSDTVVTVPAKMGEYTTVSVGSQAFKDTPVTVLNLAETTTTLESAALSESNVKAVYLPKSISSVPADLSNKSLIIFGFSGTAAQSYATSSGNDFIEIASSDSFTSYVGKNLYIDTPHQFTLQSLDALTTSEGKYVLAKKAGNAKVSITFTNGICATLALKIIAAPQSIVYPEEIKLYVGETYSQKPSISNGTYPQDDFRYKIYDTTVAKVDNDGKITALKPGTTSILVAYNGTLTATAKITVGKQTTAFTLDAHEYVIGVGEVKYLSYALGGSDEIVKKVTFTSNHPDIVAVSAKGKILAKSIGTATITATTNNGLKDTCVITVGKAPTKIKLALSAITLAQGEKVRYKVYVDPDAICSQFIWRSGNESVFKVDQSGVISGVKPGTAKLYCYTYNYKSKNPYIRADAKITVKKSPGSISFNKTNLVLGVGEKFDLNLKLPSGADCYKKTTSISDSDIIKVAKGMVITAKKEGTATFSVTTFNGKTGTCKITVKKAPSKIACKPTSIKLALKQKYQLSPYVDKGAVCSSYIYKTTNSKVCNVTDKGLIKVKDYGECHIKIYAYNHTKDNPIMCKVKVRVGYITNKISSYTTYFDPYYYGKSHNLKTACKYINGKTDGYILQPGQTFSYNAVLGARTRARGYTTAKVIEGGGYVDGMGGGICQGATTIFNATLLGNLKVVERHQHNLRSSYCPLGRDAAISWGSQDYKFTNNFNTPIRIKMNYSAGGSINCSIYSLKKVKLPKISLKVTQSGNTFTLKRYAGGKVNYTTSSTY